MELLGESLAMRERPESGNVAQGRNTTNHLLQTRVRMQLECRMEGYSEGRVNTRAVRQKL